LGHDRAELIEWVSNKALALENSGKLSRTTSAWFHTAGKMESTAISRFGFVFMAYKVRYWYFELLWMIFKFLMTSVIIFFSSLPGGTTTQLFLALCMSYSFVILHLTLKPLTTDNLNKLMSLSLMMINLNIMLKMLVEVVGGDVFPSIFGVISVMNIFVFIYPLMTIVFDVKTLRKTLNEAKKTLHELKAQDMTQHVSSLATQATSMATIGVGQVQNISKGVATQATSMATIGVGQVQNISKGVSQGATSVRGFSRGFSTSMSMKVLRSSSKPPGVPLSDETSGSNAGDSLLESEAETAAVVSTSKPRYGAHVSQASVSNGGGGLLQLGGRRPDDPPSRSRSGPPPQESAGAGTLDDESGSQDLRRGADLLWNPAGQGEASKRVGLDVHNIKPLPPQSPAEKAAAARRRGPLKPLPASRVSRTPPPENSIALPGNLPGQAT
jgi:hypothetical protein